MHIILPHHKLNDTNIKISNNRKKRNTIYNDDKELARVYYHTDWRLPSGFWNGEVV